MDAPDTKSLPENAYRPLEPGEIYQPVVPAGQAPPESTVRSVGWGLFLCVIFTVASAYSGLKVGQVMEAAIPISILAIGLARVYRRRSSLLENVIITAIGGVSGAVVAGAIFTLPALYILKLDPHPVQTIFICLAGGCLGVLFLIPLRRYFVRDMHGQLPYPEATAITEVLVTGEKGGSQAKLLLQATAIAGVYDFFVTTFQVWKEYARLPVRAGRRRRSPNARAWCSALRRHRLHPGPRATSWGCASSHDPLRRRRALELRARAADLDDRQHLPDAAVYPGAIPIAEMTAAADLPRLRALHRRGRDRDGRHLRHRQVAARSWSGRSRSPRRRSGTARASGQERTDRDMPIVTILIGVVVSARSPSAIFLGNLGATTVVTLVGLALTLVFSFFFTSVAANAIATTARNPVSGMTMLTIIISSVVLLRFGLSGTTGMFFVMAIAGHGLHGAVGLGADRHRPEDRLLAGLDAGGAGEGQVLRRDRGVGRRRARHRDAGADVPVRRGGARRHARRCWPRRRPRS